MKIKIGKAKIKEIETHKGTVVGRKFIVKNFVR
jgi:hypothetical protein